MIYAYPASGQCPALKAGGRKPDAERYSDRSAGAGSTRRDLGDRAHAAFIEPRYCITLNCSDDSTRAVGALAGGEPESAEISSDMPTPAVTPTSAKP